MRGPEKENTIKISTYGTETMIIDNTIEKVGNTLVHDQECCQALHKFSVLKLGDL
jgi:hypothetical protein